MRFPLLHAIILMSSSLGSLATIKPTLAWPIMPTLPPPAIMEFRCAPFVRWRTTMMTAPVSCATLASIFRVSRLEASLFVLMRLSCTP